MTEQEIRKALPELESCHPDDYGCYADVPALARLALDLLQWRAVWEQDSGYTQGVMDERRRVRAKAEAEMAKWVEMYNSGVTAVRGITALLDAIGPADESNLPHLPPDRTRELLARAAGLLGRWASYYPAAHDGLAGDTGEFLEEVNP